MAKALRLAILPLLGVALVAGPSLAGPGGRNGDPDWPQGVRYATPTLTVEMSAAERRPTTGLVPADRSASEAWKVMIRLFLRFQGISFR